MSDKQQIGVEFLTPTDKDDFKEEVISKDVFKITFQECFYVVKMIKQTSSVSFNIEQANFKDGDYKAKKLMGYILFKLLPRYQ